MKMRSPLKMPLRSSNQDRNTTATAPHVTPRATHPWSQLWSCGAPILRGQHRIYCLPIHSSQGLGSQPTSDLYWQVTLRDKLLSVNPKATASTFPLQPLPLRSASLTPAAGCPCQLHYCCSYAFILCRQSEHEYPGAQKYVVLFFGTLCRICTELLFQ